MTKAPQNKLQFLASCLRLYLVIHVNIERDGRGDVLEKNLTHRAVEKPEGLPVSY